MRWFGAPANGVVPLGMSRSPLFESTYIARWMRSHLRWSARLEKSHSALTPLADSTLLELHRRGPHQMRHTFASLLLAAGEPITYVSQQLGHRDPSITLHVYSHWLPDTTARKGVDRLDDALPNVAQAWPDAIAVNDRRRPKSFVSSGEPGGNRTHNPQIKSSRRSVHGCPTLSTVSDSERFASGRIRCFHRRSGVRVSVRVSPAATIRERGTAESAKDSHALADTQPRHRAWRRVCLKLSGR
jgi:integrase-like protein